jgi:hypothetical protein
MSVIEAKRQRENRRQWAKARRSAVDALIRSEAKRRVDAMVKATEAFQSRQRIIKEAEEWCRAQGDGPYFISNGIGLVLFDPHNN